MNYRISRRKRTGVRKVLLLGAILCVVGFFLLFNSVFLRIGGVVAQVNDVAFGTISKTLALFTEDTLKEQNRVLYERVQELEKQLTEKDVDFATSTMVRARVLVKPNTNIYGSLLISMEESIPTDNEYVVLNTAGDIVGIIDQSVGKTARVRLSSQNGFEQQMNIERSGVPVRVVGVGGGNMQAELPQDTDVEVGDVLIHTQTGAYAGEVLAIDRTDSDAFVTLFARLPSNVFEIATVMVVPLESIEISNTEES